MRAGSYYDIELYSRDGKNRTSGDRTSPLRVQTVPAAPQGIRISDVKAKTLTVEWDETHGNVD